MTSGQPEIETEGAISLQSERIVIAAFLVVIGGFMFFDILDDWYEGIALYHIVPEALIGGLGVVSAIFLFLRFTQSRHRALRRAHEEVIQAKKLAAEWQSRASTFRQGLSEAIGRQLKEWRLSDTEQEICFLLLKGFSLQEIADLRNTSERTVRQQASVIYKKSGLSGRIQLAAFFLEDFLSPMERITP